jgi:hypothetical protein
LRYTRHEIIVASSWRAGYRQSHGEFVCFLEPDCVLSDFYFEKLLSVFDDKPSYRKLAMVTPTLAVNDWDSKIYGYILSATSVIPSRIKSSSESYLIQIGYVPGAIIRRSAMGLTPPRNKDNMAESLQFSLWFWDNGQHIALDPDVTYVSTDTSLSLPFHVDYLRPKTVGNVRSLWKREMIG